MKGHNFCHMARSTDQGLHRDGQEGMGGATRLFALPLSLQLLYYPLNVRATHGPTCVVPHSHIFNTESVQPLIQDAQRNDAGYAVPEWADLLQEKSLVNDGPDDDNYLCFVVHSDLWHRATAASSNAVLRPMFKIQFLRSRYPSRISWNHEVGLAPAFPMDCIPAARHEEFELVCRSIWDWMCASPIADTDEAAVTSEMEEGGDALYRLAWACRVGRGPCRGRHSGFVESLLSKLRDPSLTWGARGAYATALGLSGESAVVALLSRCLAEDALWVAATHLAIACTRSEVQTLQIDSLVAGLCLPRYAPGESIMSARVAAIISHSELQFLDGARAHILVCLASSPFYVACIDSVMRYAESWLENGIEYDHCNYVTLQSVAWLWTLLRIGCKERDRISYLCRTFSILDRYALSFMERGVLKTSPFKWCAVTAASGVPY